MTDDDTKRILDIVNKLQEDEAIQKAARERLVDPMKHLARVMARLLRDPWANKKEIQFIAQQLRDHQSITQ